jgi:ribosomal protein L11 methyltransferase
MTDVITLQAGAHAFGDGSHPTTQGVLAALEGIDPNAFAPRKALDMGAGSGIVAFAVARRFSCPVLAVDIEKQAVETLAENARVNQVMGITALHADGFAHPTIEKQAPFDLIVMNILAEPLVRLAAAAERHLAEGGVLVMSGILLWQETNITQTYQTLELELTARLTVGDWVTLIFQKP